MFSLIFLLKFLVVVIPVLINVAFITLLERKILSYSQLRKGPNKVSMGGLLQPFNDAIKLFSKEMVSPSKSNYVAFSVAPIVSLTLSLLVWASYPVFSALSESYSMIIIYMILSMNIYPLMMSGWASNSNYAMIGGLRGVAQTISYEISLALVFMFILMFSSTLSLYSSSMTSSFFGKLLIFLPLTAIWLISCVAETNRTPFDFAEGESELVSGFNVEYGSGGFALIFMAEYASIYFMSTLFTLVFFTKTMSDMMSPMMSCGLVFFWIWLRATLPRYRYDMLMSLAWFTFLPASLLILFFSLFCVN